MLLNARVKAFAVSEILRESQQGGGGGLLIHPQPTLGLKFIKTS